MPSSPTLSASSLRRWVGAYLLAIGVVTFPLAALAARSHHPWIVAEWLINYRAGFVRRGLLGELLLGSAHLLHLPLLPLTAALQMTLYGLYYWLVFRLTGGLRWSLPLLAALLSPATLAFPVLDPPSSVRKEVLLFVALSGLCLLLLAEVARRPPKGARLWRVGVWLAVVAPLSVLSHEALLVFLPYLFAPLFLLLPARVALRLSCVPLLFSLAAAIAVAEHPGSGAVAEGVCASLGATYVPGDPAGFCSGAIAYLSRDRDRAFDDTRQAERRYHYGRRYPLPALLALLPASLLVGRRLRRPAERRSARILLGFAIAAMVASVPLFLLARDWGRWIEIHAVSLLLLLLLLERVPTGSASVGPGSPCPLPPRQGARVAALLAVAGYATCWTLPAVGIFPGRFGYLDLLRYAELYRDRPHLAPLALALPTNAPTHRPPVPPLCSTIGGFAAAPVQELLASLSSVAASDAGATEPVVPASERDHSDARQVSAPEREGGV